VEVVDLKQQKVLHTISGLSEPQGVSYVSRHHELFVANGGSGECVFYNAKTYQKIASVKYSDDADDARYDPATDQIFVGYGNGGIGVINAATHKQVADIKLPAHPESFQLDIKEGKLWVNLPGSGMIGVIDIKQAKLVDKWKKLLPRSNFPMAYDSSQHRVIVGYRMPATLIVMDSRTGKQLFSKAMVGDSDDLYWDDKSRQILISGGNGSINIFKQNGAANYDQVANIPTRDGARTSLWVPELRMFIVAARESGDRAASLLLYKMSAE
jgi:DNA-binding beta-propeller fold protein YncE